MLPVALRFNAPVDRIVVPVPDIILVLTLPPVMLPLALTVPALIAEEVMMLPPVTLPVELISPPVNILPPVTLALTLTVVPVCVVAFTLAPPLIFPPVMLPVVDIGFVPNAAKFAATLALPYVAGSPVSCDPLPRM